MAMCTAKVKPIRKMHVLAYDIQKCLGIHAHMFMPHGFKLCLFLLTFLIRVLSHTQKATQARHAHIKSFISHLYVEIIL